MTFAWSPPWWVALTLVVAAAAIGYLAYARPVVPLSWSQRGTLMALRVIALWLLLLFLFRPVSTEPAAMPDAVVAVLLDTSRSMRLTDGQDGRRLDQAVGLIRDGILPSVGTEWEVELLSFGDGVEALDLDRVAADGGRSDVSDALEVVRERYADRSLAAIVLLSDGGDTSGGQMPRPAAGAGAPVYAIGIGSPQPSHDLEVSGMTAGTATVEQTSVDVAVSVVSHGRGPAPLDLRLLEEGRLVDVRRVMPVGDGVPAVEVFRVSPATDGATVYTAEIDAEADEVVVENNRRSLLVQPPGRARRVLLVEGAPGYEHSFLKRAWHADPGIVLDAVVRKGQNDRGEPTFYIQGDPERTRALGTGYPVDRRTLFHYDAVVLANVQTALLRPDQLQLTADFVGERGGGLLMLGSLTLTGEGLAGSVLEPILPVSLSARTRAGGSERRDGSSDQATVTDDGLVHPITQLGATPAETRERWDELPPLGGSVALGPARPLASVLADVSTPTGEVRPLVAVQRYGPGRSMVFAGEGAWRWKMLQPAADRSYEQFWGQAMRWLTGGAADPVTLAISAGAMPGDLVELDIHVRDDTYRAVVDAEPRLMVRTPGGEGRELSPRLVNAETGHYAADFRPDEVGVYEVSLEVGQDGAPSGAVTRWVLVGGVDNEFSSPGLDARQLERVAEASEGDLVSPSDVGSLAARLRSRASDRSPAIIRDRWHGVGSFVLVLALLTVEWTLRRTWGLR